MKTISLDVKDDEALDLLILGLVRTGYSPYLSYDFFDNGGSGELIFDVDDDNVKEKSQ